MTRLSPHAKAALDTLIEKHRAYVIAKATIEAELKQELVERLSVHKSERDLALLQADQANVPRTQLGKAIGTTNYKTVQDILSLTKESEVSFNNGSSDWSLIKISDRAWSLTVNNLGLQKASGTVEVSLDMGSISFVSGDAWIIPAVYREGYADDIVKAMMSSVE